MSTPLQLAVIADDLTGGADTGVLFCPAVGPVYLTKVEGNRIELSEKPAGGIALCTNSRHLLPAAAELAVKESAEAIRTLQPKLVYKKIDSCLRGNPGVEIDTLLREINGELSFIAPALPSQGRTTEHDVHMVDGVPVAETEAGRDPLNPVTTSRLSERIAQASKRSVGHVGLDIMSAGLDAVDQHVRELQKRGCAHIVFDVVTENHLGLITALKRERFRGTKILFAGSAGLAKTLAENMVEADSRPPAAARPKIGKWLFVCGSASRVTRQQAEALARSTGWPHQVLDPSFLAAGHNSVLQQRSVAPAVANWRKSSLILSITAVREGSVVQEDPDRVISGLAELTLLLLSEASPQGIFLSGGDTAQAVLDRAGAKGLLLSEEILPGLMLGTIQGGGCDNIPIVTKAGAFGTRETLRQLTLSLT